MKCGDAMGNTCDVEWFDAILDVVCCGMMAEMQSGMWFGMCAVKFIFDCGDMHGVCEVEWGVYMWWSDLK